MGGVTYEYHVYFLLNEKLIFMNHQNSYVLVKEQYLLNEIFKNEFSKGQII